MREEQDRKEDGMKIKERTESLNGKFRKARKTHPCDIVKFFGLHPHAQCTGEIKPTQYYYDMNDCDNGSIYKTHKLCRHCAEMEYDLALMMTPEERKKYREDYNG